MSNINLKKAEVIITIDSSKQLSIKEVKLINFPFVNQQTQQTNNFEIKYSDDMKNPKNYKISTNNNETDGNRFSQIIIKNLNPAFNPLQVILVGKDYIPKFSGNSINFVDVFSSNSGSEMYIDKKQNTLTLNNFMSMITRDANVTSQFTVANKNKTLDHVIGKIIILYDMEYDNMTWGGI